MSRIVKSRNVADYHNEFVEEIRKINAHIGDCNTGPTSSCDTRAHNENGDRTPVCVLDMKVKNAFNGLETSTFTVCARIRPVLEADDVGTGENFVCIVPSSPSASHGIGDYCEPTLALVPKVSMMGKAKLEATTLDFDYTFGPEISGADIFERIGDPLVQRCFAGQVGVVFAYGQTGSGKTHTMNCLMDHLVPSLYSNTANEEGRVVTFSYIEILGQTITDCLDPDAIPGAAQVGEMLDGRVETRNIVSIACSSAAELAGHVEASKRRRQTESTERNTTSSRSHGVGIITVSSPRSLTLASSTPGRLYIIDLAGSERMADSKNHSDARLEETKAINLSLMSLKECIRARTLAGMGDGSGTEVHVPYRRSKLTLLMKDVFDMSCRRLCSTVVLAHVSPLARDVKHSLNTLQYAAPLRVSVRTKRKGSRYEVDVRDPANWSHVQVGEWMSVLFDSAPFPTGTQERVTVDTLLAASEGGIALCMMSESEMYRRVLQAFDICAGDGESKSTVEVTSSPHSPNPDDIAYIASTLYNTVWTLICDAKVRRRRPDGSLISQEDEEAEKAQKAEEQAEKAALWASREVHMKSDLVGYDGKPVI